MVYCANGPVVIVFTMQTKKEGCVPRQLLTTWGTEQNYLSKNDNNVEGRQVLILERMKVNSTKQMWILLWHVMITM